MLYSPKSSNNSKSTSATLPEINGYVINTSEIKVLEINGSTNYVFSVLPLRASAVTFRNVTIQEKNNITTAVMTIYTPTKAWIKNNSKGETQRFDGKVDVVPLNLNKTNMLSMTASMELKSGGKINSLKNAPVKTADAQYVCSSVNVWVPLAYSCASGMGHMLWDICEIEDPERRAGYRWEEQTQTTCAWIQTDPTPTGTGETTPSPPPGYDPCETGLPEGNNPPVSTIYDTPCDSVVVDCAGVAGGSAYIKPDCQTCIGGTTGLTECPPEIKDELDQYPCAKGLVTQLSSLKGDIAALIKNTFAKNVSVLTAAP